MIESSPARGGTLEMDDPGHRIYRSALNPHPPPAAINRWVPVIDEMVRACLDERIEQGSIEVTTIGSWKLLVARAALESRPSRPAPARRG